MKLYELKNEYLELLSMLSDEDCEIPQEALRDTLEGIEGEIEEKILNTVGVMETLIAEEEKIYNARRKMNDRLAKHQEAIAKKIKGLKDYVIFCMQATGVKKVLSPELRVTLSDGVAGVVIDNDEIIPAEFVTIRTERFIDKRQIKEAIKEGQEVAGAHLEKKPSLRIS